MKIKYPALLALLSAPLAQAGELVITGLFDGPLPGGLPKGVELFVTQDIADLATCGVGSANNGGGTDGQEFTFPPGPITAGSYLYVASESTEFDNFFGFTPTHTTGAVTINGDDAIELFCGGVVTDTFGDIDTDGNGEPWEYLDGWAYRKVGSAPDATFTIGNWRFSGPNALDGETDNASASDPFPVKAFADEVTGGPDGDPDTEEPAGPCFNCPELAPIADAATFDPEVYYERAMTEVEAGSSASAIKTAINEAISSDHKNLSYSEVWSALTHTDEDPGNADNVILWYKGTSIAKFSNGSGSQSSDQDNWNREHSWPKSHGFPNQSQEAYTDIHHLRPTDISVNASRGNLDFDNSDSELAEAPSNRVDDDSFEPRNEIKGDVARMMFYMDTRYEGYGEGTPDLVLVDKLSDASTPELGRLCRLIEWSNADPVDAAEQFRNNVIYEYQGNRNPYVDHPEWVAMLYQTPACTGDDGGTGDDDGGTGGDDPTTISDVVFISEYIEGSSYNKAIELYNPTASDIDLAANNYVLSRYSNGTTNPTAINLTGIIPANGTYVIANNRANSDILGKTDQISGNISHNGDDDYVLSADGTVLDSFGQVGVDPGSNYGSDDASTANNTLIRNPDVYSGDITIDDAFDPALEWTGLGNNMSDNLGMHTLTPRNLFISEYIEGSSFNKAIELYNPSGISVDLADEGYRLERFANGGTSGAAINLSGTVAGGDVFVIANPGAIQDILDEADLTSGNIAHNGDDAYVLFKQDEIVDSFGRVGEDPGSQWESNGVSTANATLVRLSSIGEGDTISDDEFFPDLQWMALPSNTSSELGSHQFGGEDDGGDQVVIGVCDDPATLIHAIQGLGDASPVVGETLIAQAVVTAAIGPIGGFFVQQDDADQDGDPASSEGLFIAFSGDLPVVGRVVRVVGEVVEDYGNTQMNVSEDWLECGSGNVTPTMLNLPFARVDSAETLEGMLVTSNQELTVSDNYRLGRFGEVALSNGRLFKPTNVFLPGSSEAQALQTANSLNVVFMGDGSEVQNPDPVIYPAGNLSAYNTLRGGDTVSSVTGVLDFDYGKYLINPTVAPTFAATNPRTSAPDIAPGNLKVASLNVLNFFNGDGQGGGFPTSRGADSAVEYERQIAKTVAAIVIMDADILGLMEIENDGFDELSAIAQLTSAVNAALNEEAYSFVSADTPIGTDAITVGFLYKNSVVDLSGAVDILDSSNSTSDEQGPLFNTQRNRPAMTQKFALVENGEQIVVSVNHFKSKGSSCGAGDDDTTTGQGNCNGTRTRAAKGLTAHLAEKFPDLPTLIIGDLNAYAKEDPITAITDADFTNLVEYFQGSEAYSYTFNGEVGYLDHALGNEKVLAKIVDVTDWHINADEPIVLDYNLEFQSEAQQSGLYAPDQYRMSDHDPVIMTLQVDAPMVGDFDGDGDIDIYDVLALVRAVQLNQAIDLSFDFNVDGIVNILDVRLMMNQCTRTRCAA